MQELLQWIFDQNRMPEMKEQASKLLESLKDNQRKVLAEVVAAMNIVEGYNYGGGWTSHWYECANGHPYFIGDCGGAMQTATCVECGELIGGQSHNLVGSNRPAGGSARDILQG
jgi:hypothetical protein